MNSRITPSTKRVSLTSVIPDEYKGMRIDAVLAKLFPEHSRERLKQWILSGECQINGQSLTPKTKVQGGEHVIIKATLPNVVSDQPENIPLNVIYEDDDLLIINKPANLVVHPAAGNRTGTLMNALLHHAPSLSKLPRAGIVHRLDKDTTGLMVVAQTIEAHTHLVKELKERHITREYEAIVIGRVVSGGTIDAPMDRHPKDRLKMAVVASGKPAVTHYWVIKQYDGCTHLRLRLETGRTHQIRVHMQYKKHPIVGDPLYAKGYHCKIAFNRPALHAIKLSLIHPTTQKSMSWEVALPEDMQQLISQFA